MSTPAKLHAISSAIDPRTNLQTVSEGKDAAKRMAQFAPDSLYKRFGVVEMNESLNSLLFRESQAGRRVIVVIDEAQNMDNVVLETIRLLSDFETKRQKLMQIILAGQPQLAHKLAPPVFAQLFHRICC